MASIDQSLHAEWWRDQAILATRLRDLVVNGGIGLTLWRRIGIDPSGLG
jgi:hypothetical protein